MKFVLFLMSGVLFSPNIWTNAAKNCPNQRSTCPQSTFTTVQEGNNWACPSLWKKSYFISERLLGGLDDLDSSNLTAEVVHSGNTTTISMCTVIPATSATAVKWPSGGYCVPSPTNQACPADSMTRITATITAPGRNFSCESNQPMTNCTEGSFDINACCPKTMSTDQAYLNPPIYEVEAFFLLKTNDTCPQLYSYTYTEESLTIPHATISPGFGFASTLPDALKITFCRYSSVDCVKRKNVPPYEMGNSIKPCDREAMIYCDTGYLVQPQDSGSYFTEYCLPDGNYSTDPKQLCGKQCPELEPVPDGNFVGYSTAPIGAVTVECEDGNFLTGDASTSCQRNGTWTSELTNTMCTFARCYETLLPDNTGVTKWKRDSSDNPFAFGHVVTFYCDNTGSTQCAHFDDLTTQQNITCLKSGNWSGVPTCIVGKNCPAPANTSTAYYLDANQTCGSSVTYLCREHYITTKPQDMTITCLFNGSWSREVPDCDTAVCPTPALNISNGEVETPVQKTTVPGLSFEGDSITFSCDPTYRLIRGTSEIICMDNGGWSGPTEPKCVLIACPMAPLLIPHGKRVDGLVNQTEYHLGNEVVYECDDNYELNYTDPVACSNNARWNPYIPTCKIVMCDRPPAVEHSIPPGPNPTFPFHTNYTYTCEQGYRTTNSTLHCEHKDGILGWQGKLPACDMVYCDAAPEISNGSYTLQPNNSSTQFPYNTHFTYSCIEGFNASETYSTNCSDGGAWIPRPGCHPVHCWQPEVLYYISNDSRTVLPYNATLRIWCDESRLYKPPQDIVCGTDGKWFEVSGDKMLTCLQPEHLIRTNKWKFAGVGIAMLVILIALILVYVVRKRRRDQQINHEIFLDTKKFVSNPGYSADNNELRGISNPTYEANQPGEIPIDRNNSRLVLRGDAESVASTATVDSVKSQDESTYDTLHGAKCDGQVETVAQLPEGQYNAINNLKSHAVDLPSRNGSQNCPPEVIHGWGLDSHINPIFDEEEDVYNIPTLNRAALPQIDPTEHEGSPMETDFDNIIYDNI